MTASQTRQTATGPASRCAASARNTARSPSSTTSTSTFAQARSIALLGENGAGKSTIASIISGLVQPTTGSMTWRGTALRARCAGRRAVGRHRPHPSGDATPARPVDRRECLRRAPADAGRPHRSRVHERRAAEQLHRLGLDASPTTLVRDLRVAAQQQVEIAKALTLNARLLDLRRADRGAWRRRDGAAFRADRPPEGGRRQLHLHQPSPRRDRPHRRPGRRPARRAARARPTRRRRCRQDAGRGDGRPAARPHVPDNPAAVPLARR